jgi:hypothetical protein
VSENRVPPTVFQILERNIGGKILAILDPSSNADAVILRATIAQPIPQIVGKEHRSEVFVHLNSVQRIEVLHKTQ